MVVQTKLDVMHQMRQSGATLDQVGNRFGITRERVRQLLAERYGSTRVQELLTATELARLAGCTWKYIKKLRQQGVIRPAMVVGHGKTLWKPQSVVAVIEYIDRHRCPVCHQPVPSNRQVYCSRVCYLEACRYKNQPEEAKRRHNERVKRWLAEHPEKARQQAKNSSSGGSGMTLRDEAVKLRESGLTYAKVGHELGITKQRAWGIINEKPEQKPAPDSNGMLTAREIARFLNVHINTVRRWSNRGMLKTYRIGNRGDRRFRREDVAAFLKGGQGD